MILAVFSAIFGFAAPFLPEVLKLFKGWQDHKQEMERMRLSAELAQLQHAWRMEEVNAHADIAEMQALHQPMPSFGVQILDRAHDSNFPVWTVIPVFWLFSFADWIATNVRPGVTWIMVAFYGATKWALYVTLTGPRFENSPASAVAQIWGDQDWAVLVLVLSYWFGQRASKAAFGGNATHGKSNM
jgi:hypothetical protein